MIGRALLLQRFRGPRGLYGLGGSDKQIIRIAISCIVAVFALANARAQETTTYAYDKLGRLIRVGYPDGANSGAATDYVYDPAGNRTSVAISGAVGDPVVFDIAADQSATEGGVLTFTVTKTGVATESQWVTISTEIGTAGSADFTAASEVLTFTAGELSKTFSVTTIQDAIYEVNETFTVILSAPSAGATLGAATQRTGTINNDDSGVAFSAGDVSITEGGNLSFTVTKTGATSLSHSVNYATANGTAVSGSDYTAASGTLTFAAGDTAKTVNVITTSDTTYELNENLQLNLSNATNGATISDAQAIGSINNDDAGPTFTVNNVSVTEGGNLVFTVTKSGGTSQAHNVNYATSNGTAGAGSDYTAKSGTLSFTASQTSKTVSIVTIQDTIFESNETVNLNLSNATNGATISDALGVGTINNDDAPPNQPPTVNDETLVIDEFQSGNVYPLANDTDPENDPLTVASWTSSSSNITVSYNASQKRFDITGWSAGIYTVNYMVSDGHDAENGGPIQGTITVDVRPGDPCGPLGCGF